MPFAEEPTNHLEFYLTLEKQMNMADPVDPPL